MNFAQLIAPCTLEEFFGEYYEQKFLLNQRNQADYYQEVLNEQDIDDFFSQQNLNPAAVSLMRNGLAIPPEKWIHTNEKLPGVVKTTIRSSQIFEQFYQGVTLILNAAEKTISRLAEACRAIEQETSIRVQANIYITPPNSQGFKMHYDTHDIFSMQIKGAKTWKIYDSGEQLPTSLKPFTREPVLVSEFELKPGDLFYIPRGVVHEAFATDVSTIHVNFSCKPQYGFNLIEDLAKVAEQGDVFFRRTVPNSFSSASERKNYIELFSKKLAELMVDTKAEKLLDMQCRTFAAKQTLNYQGRFTDALSLENLRPDSLVSRRRGVVYDVSYVGSDVTIRFGDRQLIIPKFVDKGFFLLDDPFHISDIKGLLTQQGKIAIAREFIEAGFLQIEELQ